MRPESSERRAVLVTGGNDGIGRALCRQLAAEEGVRVLLGARNVAKGEAAVRAIAASLPADAPGSVELLCVDVARDDSVAAAASEVRTRLVEGERLYGLVNNAGVGLATGGTADETLNTNLYGVKRMVDAFVGGGLVGERVVNVGSGSGPTYVSRCPEAIQPALCKRPADWEAIEGLLAPSDDGRSGLGSAADRNAGYGLSKALLSLYTMHCAAVFPDVLHSCVSPGWIRTKLVGSDGPSLGPEEGTRSLRHALFAPLDGNGWYYGSDAVRSPLHFMRNPGEPAYDGRVDGVVGVGSGR